MKALIVCQCADLSKALLRALQEFDFEPVVRSTLCSKSCAEGADFPLVITSWHLDATNGVEVCRSIRQHETKPRPLILVVTHPCSGAELGQLLDAGADDYLFHPIDADLLRVRLRIAARRIHDRAQSAQAEELLRASNDRFQFAVSGANDGLWDAVTPGANWRDPNTKVWFSPRTKQLLGFTDAEFPDVLASWESQLHPDDRNRVHAALADHIERRLPYDVEYRLRTKSGEYRWFSARGQAIWNESGEPIRMSGSLRDITKTKEDEAKIEKSEALWRSLVENAPDIIILADLDGTIRFINRSTPVAIESIGRSMYDYIDEDFRVVMRGALQAVAATGKPQRFEVHGQTDQGIGMLWYANCLGPVFRSGKVESVVLIARDITERKTTERRLERDRQMQSRLLDLQERERQLVSYEIHDGLVQYLTAGLMHLETFANVDDTADAHSLAEYESATKLIRDGLAEARRLISGLRPPILDEQGVAAALEYLVNEARKDIPDISFANRTLFGRLAAPLEVALFRITQEALSNIRKHSGAKRAQVDLLQHGDLVRLRIRDWGCGFDPAKVQEERFGLQGIRQRAHLLGTTAIIESAAGQGTIIVVDFPIVGPSHSGSNLPSGATRSDS